MSEGVLDHRLSRSLHPHDIGHHRAEKRLSRPQKSEDGGDGGHGDAERGAKRNLEAASDLAKVRPLRQGPVDGSAAIRKHRNPSLHSGRRNVHPNQTSAVATNFSGDQQLQVGNCGEESAVKVGVFRGCQGPQKVGLSVCPSVRPSIRNAFLF